MRTRVRSGDRSTTSVMVAFQESPELAVTEILRPWRSAGRVRVFPLEASAPDAALYLGRGPSREGDRRRGLDRGDRLLDSRRSGTELAIEGLVDEGSQPGADVEVTLGAEALEALTRFGRDADVNRNTVQHNTTP